MTVLMSFVGLIVFTFSTFTVGFKAAWKRLMVFAITGLIIDSFIIGISLMVSFAVSH